MEDLALLVMGILLGLLVLGVAGVILAILSRRGKVNRYWPLGFAVALAILAIVAWQGSDRMAMIPLGFSVLASAIALWPSPNK